MIITLPEDVKNIIERLKDCGHEAYAVGGCVRDTVLGKTPADWDITTSAKPQQVKEIFSKTFDTGIEHGTVTVLLNHVGYEVTTYRIDGEYEDGRHPKQVEFTSSLEEDLKRRDFTINAMAYNDNQGLVDLFGGMEDLDKGVIRCVGNPMERFDEDALRMLRALRFAAQLDFEIDSKTIDAIVELAPTIEKVSKERIMVELVKMLVSDHPDRLREVVSCGLSKYFLPELDVMFETEQNNKHHCYTVGEHTMQALLNVPNDKILRLTMLLHDVAKPLVKKTDETGVDHFKTHPIVGADMAVEILRRLKFDNNTISKVKKLVLHHDDRPVATEKAVRRAAVKMGPECFPEIFAVKRADTLAQSTWNREEKLREIDDFENIYHNIIEQNQCISKKDMMVNGRDIMDLGAPQGKIIGEVLDRLFEEIVDDPELNDRDYLIIRAKQLLGEI
ncbi:MAG: CCA tRNA nucleotidyltransferase [Lachnospiraceae bacterium]|nr:CCA tRNA nucleotidyltransferase [Lachnospiraceae bacterium]